MKDTKALVLAAGKGTRMKSDLPKVLHKIGRKTMIEMVVEALEIKDVCEIIVIVSEDNIASIKEILQDRVSYLIQKERLGTAHAVMQASDFLEDFDGNVIVVVGDAPFITKKLMNSLLEKHTFHNNQATFLTAVYENPPAYGRIIRSAKGKVLRIVEERDATELEKRIKEVNSSHYCFENNALQEALQNIDNKNAQCEYYLPDTIENIVKSGGVAESLVVEDNKMIQGINTKEQLKKYKV